jgi:hypothetical protein
MDLHHELATLASRVQLLLALDSQHVGQTAGNVRLLEPRFLECLYPPCCKLPCKFFLGQATNLFAVLAILDTPTVSGARDPQVPRGLSVWARTRP